MLWKKLGKEGLAVRAPWPVAEEEDKIRTREAKFLRDTLKQFRTMHGKAKKGFTNVSIVVGDTYPQWKIDILTWMQSIYDTTTGFPASFMKDLKTYTGNSGTEKKMIKFTMQFASFVKKEVEDAGPVAMDVQLPFDQKEILSASLEYIKAQLNVTDLNVMKVGEDEEISDKVADSTTPGNPYLWMR
jgi:leucyl-tRNA synthetase